MLYEFSMSVNSYYVFTLLFGSLYFAIRHKTHSRYAMGTLVVVWLVFGVAGSALYFGMTSI